MMQYELVEAVRSLIVVYRRRHVGSGYSRTDSETVGEFAGVGGARVEVYAFAEFTFPFVLHAGRVPHVAVGAGAKCAGFGCADPELTRTLTEARPLGDGVDVDSDGEHVDVDGELAREVVPFVQKAREWAQSHAETCRAMPRPEAGGR